MRRGSLPPAPPRDGLAKRRSTSRVFFWAIVAAGGLLPWLAPRPPMVDLPQHAGQIAVAMDLLRGDSPWRELLTINPFTPYVVSYVLAGFLASIVSIGPALKMLLTAAFYGFALAAVGLRRQCLGDARLDWLLIPGFFGYAYKWGFFPYLISAPIGLLFLSLALVYSERPTLKCAGCVFALGLLLFFSHGVVFLCCVAAGALGLVVRPGRAGWRTVTFAPYLALGVVLGAYLWHPEIHDVAARATRGELLEWNLSFQRAGTFFVYPWGTGEDWMFVPAGLVMFAAPFFIGSRLQADVRCRVPFVCLAAFALLAPSRAFHASADYERLGLFVLPFYALMFRGPSVPAPTARRGDVGRAAQIAMALICAVTLLAHAWAAVGFARESSAFEAVLDAARPGRRALSLVFDPGSSAARNARAYLHFPLWYQAERGGLVDYSFACVAPFPVRFRVGALPDVQPGFEWAPERFEWERHAGARYDYFFVRRTAPLPDGFFRNPAFDVRMIRSAGEWMLYEKTRRAKP